MQPGFQPLLTMPSAVHPKSSAILLELLRPVRGCREKPVMIVEWSYREQTTAVLRSFGMFLRPAYVYMCPLRYEI